MGRRWVLLIAFSGLLTIFGILGLWQNILGIEKSGFAPRDVIPFIGATLALVALPIALKAPHLAKWNIIAVFVVAIVDLLTRHL